MRALFLCISVALFATPARPLLQRFEAVEHHTVKCDVNGMALDVGAIGKGYAASEALEVLGGLGVRSALVAVSGDLAFSDAPRGQRGWKIGIHSGDPSVVKIPRVLELTNAAVSTSGNSE